ncbi:MAG: HPr family phosphocarrier protein [Porticoccaceae bacterium]
MIEIKIEVVNKLGLHARASSKLAQLAARYASDIRLGKEGESPVDAKSIMGLMLLAAGIGSRLVLRVEGEDEQDAVDAITKLFADKFDEGE